MAILTGLPKDIDLLTYALVVAGRRIPSITSADADADADAAQSRVQDKTSQSGGD